MLFSLGLLNLDCFGIIAAGGCGLRSTSNRDGMDLLDEEEDDTDDG